MTYIIQFNPLELTIIISKEYNNNYFYKNLKSKQIEN